MPFTAWRHKERKKNISYDLTAVFDKMPLETLGNNFEKLLKCKFCFVKTKSKADLESHILLIHGGKKPECTICHTTFWKEHHLKTHE